MSEKRTTIGKMPEFQKKFCMDLMNKIMLSPLSRKFKDPLSSVVSSKDFKKSIEKQMDLSIARSNLENGKYDNTLMFEKDIELVFKNVIDSLDESNDLVAMAKDLLAMVRKEMCYNAEKKWFEVRFVEEKWLHDANQLYEKIKELIKSCPIKESLVPEVDK